MIPTPFKKGYKVQNRTNAINFLIEHVFKFDEVVVVPPNTIVVNGKKSYRVHAYCESSKAMVATPLDKENCIATSPVPVIMVHKPVREDKIIIYQIDEPARVGNIPFSNSKCSVEWGEIRKVANLVYVVNLETGGLNEFNMSKM
jgi:hypothetical protein